MSTAATRTWIVACQITRRSRRVYLARGVLDLWVVCDLDWRRAVDRYVRNPGYVARLRTSLFPGPLLPFEFGGSRILLVSRACWIAFCCRSFTAS